MDAFNTSIIYEKQVCWVRLLYCLAAWLSTHVTGLLRLTGEVIDVKLWISVHYPNERVALLLDCALIIVSATQRTYVGKVIPRDISDC